MINKIKIFFISAVLIFCRCIIFNSVRMFIYKYILRINVGYSTLIWAGNVFNDVYMLEIGDTSIIGPNNIFLISGGLKIGNNVNISGFSYFISQSHRVDDPEYKVCLSKIVIEDDVWIATNVTILPGVKIGRGAVVAAGAVVTKDVPAFTVVGGNPAKEIAERCKSINYKLKAMAGRGWL